MEDIEDKLQAIHCSIALLKMKGWPIERRIVALTYGHYTSDSGNCC
jgi:hypothetical protein